MPLTPPVMLSPEFWAQFLERYLQLEREAVELRDEISDLRKQLRTESKND